MMESLSSVLSVKAICLLIASNNFLFTDVLGIELTSVYISSLYASYSCPVYSVDSILYRNVEIH